MSADDQNLDRGFCEVNEAAILLDQVDRHLAAAIGFLSTAGSDQVVRVRAAFGVSDGLGELLADVLDPSVPALVDAG